MKFELFAAALATAGTALAVPSPRDAFKLRAVTDKQDVNGKYLKAKAGRYYVGPAKEGATCEGGKQEDATFYLKDGSIFLYNTNTAVTPQQTWTDRSGMGQGVTGYFDLGTPTTRYGQVKTWTFDANNHLNIDGNPWYLCPNQDGNWYLWVWSENATPGYNQGCVKTQLEHVSAPKALSCTYTKQQQ